MISLPLYFFLGARLECGSEESAAVGLSLRLGRTGTETASSAAAVLGRRWPAGSAAHAAGSQPSEAEGHPRARQCRGRVLGSGHALSSQWPVADRRRVRGTAVGGNTAPTPAAARSAARGHSPGHQRPAAVKGPLLPCHGHARHPPSTAPDERTSVPYPQCATAQLRTHMQPHTHAYPRWHAAKLRRCSRPWRAPCQCVRGAAGSR